MVFVPFPVCAASSMRQFTYKVVVELLASVHVLYNRYTVYLTCLGTP